MKDAEEKFEIRINDNGLLITTRDGNEKSILLKAGEALMLLDILKNEEEKLRQLARKESPLPVEIKFD